MKVYSWDFWMTTFIIYTEFTLIQITWDWGNLIVFIWEIGLKNHNKVKSWKKKKKITFSLKIKY